MPGLSSFAGYDRDVSATLAPRERRWLHTIGGLTLLSAVAVGGCAALGLWQVERAPALAAVAGLGFGAMWWNLLRLLIAGGGTPVELELDLDGEAPPTWRPRRTAWMLALLLAAFFAQPLLLEVFDARLGPEVATHRAALLQAHARGVLRAGDDATDGFSAHVARSRFTAHRLRVLWRDDRREPALLTLLFGLAVTAPLWLARRRKGVAVQRFEAARYQRAHALVSSAQSAADAEVARLLHRHRTRHP